MAETTVVVAEKFSWWTAILKALKNTLLPMIALGVGFIIQNPAIITQLLGQWSQMTLATLVLYVLQLIQNWLKNKDLGK